MTRSLVWRMEGVCVPRRDDDDDDDDDDDEKLGGWRGSVYLGGLRRAIDN